MLAGDEASAGRELLKSTHFELGSDDVLEQPELEQRMGLECLHGPAPRPEQKRAAEHDEQCRRHKKEEVEQKGARHVRQCHGSAASSAATMSPPDSTMRRSS